MEHLVGTLKQAMISKQFNQEILSSFSDKMSGTKTEDWDEGYSGRLNKIK